MEVQQDQKVQPGIIFLLLKTALFGIFQTKIYNYSNFTKHNNHLNFREAYKNHELNYFDTNAYSYEKLCQ